MGGARGGKVGYVRSAARRSALAGVALAALALCSGTALAYDARVGWSPVQGAAGYRVYVRQSGQAFSGALDVGLIQAGADGVIRYIMSGLPIGVTNYFAVTAYDTSARESAFSNELSLLVTATPTAGAAATGTPTAPRSATPNPALPTVTATRTATRTAFPPSTAPPTATSSPVGTVAGGGLVAACAFSEGSGTTTGDGSGQGYVATLFGSPAWTGGRYGSALEFSGGTTWDGVNLAPNNRFDGLSQGTLEAWVRFDTSAPPGNYSWFNGRDAAGCSYPFEFNVNNRSGTAYWEIWAGDTAQCTATFRAQVALANPGQWHHLAYVVSNSGNTWYVDGVAQTPTYFAGSASTKFFFASIAASPNTRYDIGTCDIQSATFNGTIDEVRIYARPLSQAEIRTDMNAPVGGAVSTSTATRTASRTATATNTPVPTAQATAARTPTASATGSRTRTATRTATRVPPTPSATASRTRTATRVPPTSSATATRTRTATRTATRPPSTASATASRTRTATRTTTRPPSTASATASRTRTATRTPTRVPPAGTATPTATPSRTRPGMRHGVSGRIRYRTGGAPVPHATLMLHGTQGALTATTDGIGQFGFAGIAAGTWMLEPQMQGDFQNAVTALDAAYVLQVVSGTRTLDALARMACDATGNGTLSALDATRILQLAVGRIARLPVAQTCGTDWAFVPQPLSVPGQRIVPPSMSGTSCRLGGIAFEPLQGNAAQQDFSAALFGDCTGNWTSAGSGAALRIGSSAVQAWLGAPRARPGERWVVPLYVQGPDTFDAVAAHVGYDPTEAELEVVRPVGAATDAMMRYHADDSGQVAVALASAHPLAAGERALAVLIFRAADPPQVWLLDAMVDETSARIAE